VPVVGRGERGKLSLSTAPMRPAVLLYDWDNTLVDGWAGLTAALNATFSAFGLPAWSVAETKARVRLSFRESFPVLFGPERWEAARDHFIRVMEARHLDHPTPIPGVAGLLEVGAAWLQGVVSNKHGRFLRPEITALGWDGHFQVVVGAGEAPADKPDPAPIWLALERLARAPGPDTWYLGDTAIDMRAARAAGCTAVLVGDAAHDGGIARAAPDLHFGSVAEAAARLRELA
jgi:phosphoglycolate phosphatase